MMFLFTFLISIICAVGGFVAPRGWQTILLWVSAILFWIISSVFAEKLVWKMEDYDTRINNLEKRVDKLEGKNKK